MLETTAFERFSCKDFSKLSQSANKREILKTMAGSSGKTFGGMIAYVAMAKPRTVILETVDELEGDSNPNCVFLYECFAQQGYSIAQATLTSSEFGSPQGRRRTTLGN